MMKLEITKKDDIAIKVLDSFRVGLGYKKTLEDALIHPPISPKFLNELKTKEDLSYYEPYIDDINEKFIEVQKVIREYLDLKSKIERMARDILDESKINYYNRYSFEITIIDEEGDKNDQT